MLKHYVLTPAYRGPDYPIEANRRRVELLRRVTAASLSVQGTEWTWVVYVNPADPLLAERLDAFRSAGAPVIPIEHSPEDVIDWSGPVLTTRIDDDDAFARDAFRRLRDRVTDTRTVWMFPRGYRINDGQQEPILHRRNAWASLYAPQGQRIHIRQVAHPQVQRLAPVRTIDTDPAWLWVRHQDAKTAFRRAIEPITEDVRRRYAVDWAYLEDMACSTSSPPAGEGSP